MTREENVEAVRRGNAAWNAGDWEALEANSHPDVEMTAPEGWPEAGEFKGWPAVRRQYERLKDMEDEHAELIEIESVDDHRVLSRYRWTGTGHGSGLKIDMPVWRIDEIRDGRVTRIEFFLDEEKAMQAAARR